MSNDFKRKIFGRYWSFEEAMEHRRDLSKEEDAEVSDYLRGQSLAEDVQKWQMDKIQKNFEALSRVPVFDREFDRDVVIDRARSFGAYDCLNEQISEKLRTQQTPAATCYTARTVGMYVSDCYAFFAGYSLAPAERNHWAFLRARRVSKGFRGAVIESLCKEIEAISSNWQRNHDHQPPINSSKTDISNDET